MAMRALMHNSTKQLCMCVCVFSHSFLVSSNTSSKFISQYHWLQAETRSSLQHRSHTNNFLIFDDFYLTSVCLRLLKIKAQLMYIGARVPTNKTITDLIAESCSLMLNVEVAMSNSNGSLICDWLLVSMVVALDEHMAPWIAVILGSG